MIDSLENEKVKLIGKLKQSKYRKEYQIFVVEGRHLVLEAEQMGLLIEGFSTEDSDYTLVSPKVMKKMISSDSNISTIGLCKMIPQQNIEDKILILDAIQDPGNMGTLLRSAVAFGFRTIFLGNGCVDIYNDKVIRASQGAIFKLNYLYGDISSFLESLRGYQIYITDVHGGRPLSEISCKNKVGVILGNEGNGVSLKLLQTDLPKIYIPMQQTESLNVAVAGSIILYHLSRN